MRAILVPAALMERLGDAGSAALTDMLDAHNQACADHVFEKSAERFEWRLIEETSKLRVDMAALRADLHNEMVSSRFELLKWNFVFWLGQILALLGMISVMLRTR